jgi:hypothetical protein
MTSIFPFTNPFIELLHQAFLQEFHYEGNLDELHSLLQTDKIQDTDKQSLCSMKKIGVNDRDSVLIKAFHKFVDSNPIFNETYLQFLRTYIKPMFSSEEKLVVQATPNIRISLPNFTAIGAYENDKEEVIGLHSDSDFGHFEGEINVVIPITKMFDSNSIYYEPFVNSNVDYRYYRSMNLQEHEFAMAYFNRLKHYNRKNYTGKTRISFDIRVIPYSKYIANYSFFENTKFDLGKYYITL